MARSIYMLAVLLPLLAVSGANAETSDAPVGAEPDLNCDLMFQHGRYEGTITTGFMFSPFLATKGRPDINYTLTEVQLGYMASGVKGTNWYRGSIELAGEAFGGAIAEGHGDYVTGITLWFRYNFVPAGWRLIPFGQAGLGLTFTDIDHDIVGQTFNFNLDLGFGLRWIVSRKCSVNAEFRYQHISNADTGPKNIGINACGPIVGVSYFF